MCIYPPKAMQLSVSRRRALGCAQARDKQCMVATLYVIDVLKPKSVATALLTFVDQNS